MADERSVGELLDELFGFESVAKRQTALEQYDRGELVRKARSREPITAKLVANMLEMDGVNRIIAVAGC